MKVYNYYGLTLPKGAVGIEIEVEGASLPQVLDKYWNVERDGSLRGESAEYVLDAPKTRLTAFKALDYLDAAFKDNNSKLNFSHRTSVHVHINVKDMTRNELVNFIYLSYLFDNCFARIGDRPVKGNRFCLRLIDAEEPAFWLQQAMKRKGFPRIPQMQEAKYSAVNICPISKYGSVEFRTMKGTMDVKLLKDWVDILLRLREYSCSKNTIKELMEGFIEDEKAFVEKIFGKLSTYFIADSLYNELRMNYSLLIGCLYEAVYNEEEIDNREKLKGELFNYNIVGGLLQ